MALEGKSVRGQQLPERLACSSPASTDFYSQHPGIRIPGKPRPAFPQLRRRRFISSQIIFNFVRIWGSRSVRSGNLLIARVKITSNEPAAAGSAPFFRALVVDSCQVYSGEGADNVIQSACPLTTRESVSRS